MLCSLLLFLQILVLSSADTLLLAQTIFRHGARAPLKPFSSPEAKEYFYRGIGELTDIGVQQAMDLGNSLKKRLVDTNFLDKRYIPSENSFYSSARLRCLMTASAVGSSMFSSGEMAIPVAVLTETDETKNICLPPSPPLVAKELLRIGGLDPNSNVKHANDVLDLILDKWIANTTFLKNRTMAFLANSIIEERDNGFTAPDWFNQSYDKEGKDIILKGISFVTGTGEFFNGKVIKCRSGLLLFTIVENMKKTINCSGNCVKFYAYSTHDTMVQPILAAFGLMEAALKGEILPTSSAILIELWKTEKENEEPYVKVLWRVPGADFVSLSQNFTGCNPNGNCPFSLFISSISNYSTSQPNIDCAVDNTGGKTSIFASISISLYVVIFM